MFRRRDLARVDTRAPHLQRAPTVETAETARPASQARCSRRRSGVASRTLRCRLCAVPSCSRPDRAHGNEALSTTLRSRQPSPRRVPSSQVSAPLRPLRLFAGRSPAAFEEGSTTSSPCCTVAATGYMSHSRSLKRRLPSWRGLVAARQVQPTSTSRQSSVSRPLALLPSSHVRRVSHRAALSPLSAPRIEARSTVADASQPSLLGHCLVRLVAFDRAVSHSRSLPGTGKPSRVDAAHPQRNRRLATLQSSHSSVLQTSMSHCSQGRPRKRSLAGFSLEHPRAAFTAGCCRRRTPAGRAPVSSSSRNVRVTDPSGSMHDSPKRQPSRSVVPSSHSCRILDPRRAELQAWPARTSEVRLLGAASPRNRRRRVLPSRRSRWVSTPPARRTAHRPRTENRPRSALRVTAVVRVPLAVVTGSLPSMTPYTLNTVSAQRRTRIRLIRHVALQPSPRSRFGRPHLAIVTHTSPQPGPPASGSVVPPSLSPGTTMIPESGSVVPASIFEPVEPPVPPPFPVATSGFPPQAVAQISTEPRNSRRRVLVADVIEAGSPSTAQTEQRRSSENGRCRGY